MYDLLQIFLLGLPVFFLGVFFHSRVVEAACLVTAELSNVEGAMRRHRHHLPSSIRFERKMAISYRGYRSYSGYREDNNFQG